jgi:hypothetical protein
MHRGTSFLFAVTLGLLAGQIEASSSAEAAPAGPGISGAATQTEAAAPSDIRRVQDDGYEDGDGQGYDGRYGRGYDGGYGSGYYGGYGYRRYYTPYRPYPYPNSYPPYRPSCDYWRARCAENWGYGGPDFYGCLRYEGCY